MISRCDLKANSECHCQSTATCVAQTKTVAPVIRFSPRAILAVSGTVGLLVFMIGAGLAKCDDSIHQHDLDTQESGVITWKR